MNAPTEQSENGKPPTVEEVLRDWVDMMDLQNVMDYPPRDLYCIACVRIVIETPDEADDDDYWTAIEYVYLSEYRNYHEELKEADAVEVLREDESWITYMNYQQHALEVLKAKLDEWSQHEFGTPYEDPK